VEIFRDGIFKLQSRWDNVSTYSGIVHRRTVHEVPEGK